MSLPPQALSKYDYLTLKSPYFLGQIRQITSSISGFSQPLETTNPSLFSDAGPNSLDLLLWSFSREFLKKCLRFFSSGGEFRHEFVEDARVFLKSERLYIENLKPSPSNATPIEVFSKFWPFCIRTLYFLEGFHSALLMKSREQTVFEVEDQWLLFPLRELSNFIDDLALILNNCLKKLIPTLARLKDEKGVLMRIFSFISFMKALNYNENLSEATEHYSQEKLERKVKELLSKFNEKHNLDVKVTCEDDTPKLSRENYLISATNNEAKNQLKRNGNARGEVITPSPLQNLDKPSPNFFSFEEEVQKLVPHEERKPQKQEARWEDLRRSSCKIIENSGLTRNLGESANGFFSYMANKNMYANPSVLKSNRLKESKNLPMNCKLSEIHPTICFYHNPPERQTASFLPDPVISSPKFAKSQPFPKSSFPSEDYEKLNQRLSDNLMREILEPFNSKSSEKKGVLDHEEFRRGKTKKPTTLIPRAADRENSIYSISITKSNSKIEEGLTTAPSKWDLGGSESRRNNEKKQENKSETAMPKFGFTELRVNSKTQINEKLVHSNFNEKSEQNNIFDEDLILSSRCSVENLDDKKGNNNHFLDFLQTEKKGQNYMLAGNLKKGNVEDMMTLSMRVTEDNDVIRKQKSRSIAHKNV